MPTAGFRVEGLKGLGLDINHGKLRFREHVLPGTYSITSTFSVQSSIIGRGTLTLPSQSGFTYIRFSV